MPDPVILIPGFMCDARLFGHLLISLSRDRMVSVMVPQGATIEEMSQAVLDAAPARFALEGHGLGGLVALDVMRRDMGRVTRAAFLAVDPLGETPAISAMREKRMILARTGRLAQAFIEEVPLSALGYCEAREDVHDLAINMALSLGETMFVAQSRALQRRRDQQKTLRRATIPVLVLAGKSDTLVPPRRQSFMAELTPSGRVVILQDAGHLAPLETPEAVTDAVIPFLNGPLLLG
jgi:pimeloyl-ACP methyl ester carboxylesterase